MQQLKYDIAVIGGGPAGLAAAIKASEQNKTVLLIEREEKLGGILKQCIHDGFGLLRFNEKLTGTEYAERYVKMIESTKVDVKVLTFVTKIVKDKNGKFLLYIVNSSGVTEAICDKLILATGCRERTARQVNIHGTHPSGVFTAGTAQYYTNILGAKVFNRTVILGSGDIGLIMARRITLEGGKVLGVYELKSTPSGLTRNVHQCLHDFDTPLYLSHTVTRVFGNDRLEGVEVARVDENFNVIEESRQKIDCDTLILSVGLIPENELAESLNIAIDNKTKGAICDQNNQTLEDGVFVCGNAQHVNDLVDYVSISGEVAGMGVSLAIKERKLIDVEASNDFLYVVPQKIDINSLSTPIKFLFRSKNILKNVKIKVIMEGKEIANKKFAHLLPPEMESLEVDLAKECISENSKIQLFLEVV